MAAIDTDPTRLSTQIVDKTIIMGDRGVLLAVLDGMGGAASGDVASALGREVLLRGVHEATIDSLQDLAEALGAATVQAHSAIRDRAAVDSSCSGMGTTLTAAGVLGDQAVIVQIGDSRAYVLRGGELVPAGPRRQRSGLPVDHQARALPGGRPAALHRRFDGYGAGRHPEPDRTRWGR
ncbi:MAG: hypothetical protein CSA24_02360 [Deltaproteobacteria bacterium]|nr:MAG: hypothetical protein CSA24_02360 [Deltaproteobacteria bacterium]